MEKEIIVRKNIAIKTPVEKVWEVLTKPEFTKIYMFNCEVNTDWQVGSPITWKGNYQGYEAFQKGVVMKYEPGKLIQYTTFDPNFGLEDIPENYLHVSYEVINHGDHTELIVTTENFGGDEKRAEHTATAWGGMVLPKIKELLEEGINEASGE